MPSSGTKGYFVTGTDTGVGKTLASCALLRAFSGRGVRAVGMKPIAAGGQRTAAGLRHDDVERLLAAGNVAASRELVNPYGFEPAIAPHLAAREAGVRMALSPIRRAYETLRRAADVVIVEGVGGFRVPVNEREDTADLAALLALPVIVVVGVRLGCLNHALLTAAAVQARGLRLAGWIANCVDSATARAEDNIEALEDRLPAPCVARIPYQAEPWSRCAARLIAIERLTGSA